MPAASKAPLTFRFAGDGFVPNNPLPMLLYRGALNLSSASNPEERIEKLFKDNGWGRDMWRDGVFPYVHYHSMIHELLGVARGRAKVRFGGSKGEELEIAAGDIAVLPAGTGHQRISASVDFLVIGAYPPGGTYNLCRASKPEHDEALKTIPQVPLPETDPVIGKGGPLLQLWRAAQ